MAPVYKFAFGFCGYLSHKFFHTSVVFKLQKPIKPYSRIEPYSFQGKNYGSGRAWQGAKVVPIQPGTQRLRGAFPDLVSCPHMKRLWSSSVDLLISVHVTILTSTFQCHVQYLKIPYSDQLPVTQHV